MIKESDIVTMQSWHSSKSEWVTQHRMEYKDAMELIKNHPNNYRFDPLKRFIKPFIPINIRSTPNINLITSKKLIEFISWIITIIVGMIAIYEFFIKK